MKRKHIVWSILIFLIVIIAYGFYTAFDPEYSQAEIKQNIGGILICNTVYYPDQHSWQYVVKYQYKNTKGKVFKVGDGTYYGREWKKDEQLFLWRNWAILKTGGWIGTDKVIITDFKTQKLNEYEFSPDSIEGNRVWISSKTHSLKNYCCGDSFVTKIDSGKIEILYRFRINETKTDLLNSRRIIYQINPESGEPAMIKVEDLGK